MPRHIHTFCQMGLLSIWGTIIDINVDRIIVSSRSLQLLANRVKNSMLPSEFCIYKLPKQISNIFKNYTESALTGGKIIAEIPCSSWRKPCYYHSFGMSKNWIVFIESPLRIDVLKIMAGAALSKPFIDAMVWDTNFKVNSNGLVEDARHHKH